MTALRPSLPLGLASIAAILKQAGHEITVLDAVGEAPGKVTPDGRLHYLGLTVEEIIERIDPKAQVIGVTNLWSFSWPLLRSILNGIKERYPEKTIVAGGEHFTGMPEFSLNSAKLDFIVIGEGEETILELISALERGEKEFEGIKGLVFKKNGRIVNTGRRPRIKNPDKLPWPAWEFFNPKAYYEHSLVMGLDRGMTMPILATRGCPYDCTYCSSAYMWTRKWYPRNPIDVVDEMEYYHEKFGATNFPFHDLTAILKRSWIKEFCNEIIRRDLKVTWQFPSGTRCEVIDEEIARLMSKAGCSSLAFAPESGSMVTRKLIRKRMTDEALFKAIRASVKAGLNVTCFFVIGFPHDTWEEIKKTLKLVRKLAVLGIDDIAIGFFFPIPGTTLYYELLEKKKIELTDRFLLTPIFANDEKLRPENNYCENLSARKLTLIKYLMLLNFYPISFGLRPWRLFKIPWNVLKGVETRKLETYLNDLKKKAVLWIKTKLGFSEARKKSL